MKYIVFLFSIFLITTNLHGQNPKFSVHIDGTTDFLKTGDSVKLSVYKYGIVWSLEPLLQTEYISIVNNDSFHFSFTGKPYPQFVTLTFGQQYKNSLTLYVVEAGANIHLRLINGKVEVTGQKSRCFEFQYRINQLQLNFDQNNIQPTFDASNLKKRFLISDSLTNIKVKILQGYKRKMSSTMFQFLKTSIYASNINLKNGFLTGYGGEYLDPSYNLILNSYEDYKKISKENKVTIDAFNVYSDPVIHSLISQYYVDSCLQKKKPFDIVSALTFFSNNYRAIAREQLTMTLISEMTRYPKELEGNLNNLLISTTKIDYRKIIQQMKLQRVDGAKAYNFSLSDETGRKIKLSDFKDQVIVLDFWFTGCFACRETAPFISKLEREFQNLPVKFMSISTDKDIIQWRKSVKSGQYVSPDIVNLYTNGKGPQHDVIKRYRVTSYPTLIVINKSGQIFNVLSDPRYDNAGELRKLILSNLNNLN